MAKPFGLSRNEKRKSRKQIDTLFSSGRSLAVAPLRVTYQFLPSSELPPARIGVTVSKRNFKKAVDRNRVKRLLREAYRLQKGPLVQALQEKETAAVLFFMYTDKAIAPFNVVYSSMQSCLQRLQQRLSHEKRT